MYQLSNANQRQMGEEKFICCYNNKTVTIKNSSIEIRERWCALVYRVLLAVDVGTVICCAGYKEIQLSPIIKPSLN